MPAWLAALLARVARLAPWRRAAHGARPADEWRADLGNWLLLPWQ